MVWEGAWIHLAQGRDKWRVAVNTVRGLLSHRVRGTYWLREDLIAMILFSPTLFSSSFFTSPTNVYKTTVYWESNPPPPSSKQPTLPRKLK